jgi:RNA polymerase sigma factor (TIGR02999 family)
MSSGHEITSLLERQATGDERALEELMPVVYSELAKIARRHLIRERAAHTLQPTALIHETYLRLVGQEGRTWRNRAQFFFFCSHLMRQILVDYARSKATQKRGAEQRRVTFDESLDVASTEKIDVLQLDEAIAQLAGRDTRRAKVVEMRYFGGMTVDEIAIALGSSASTVARDLRFSLAWLRREMSGRPHDAGAMGAC